jgi:hypothetical protein
VVAVSFAEVISSASAIKSEEIVNSAFL